MENLPKDILGCLVAFLPPQTVGRLSLVEKILQGDFLWNQILHLTDAHYDKSNLTLWIEFIRSAAATKVKRATSIELRHTASFAMPDSLDNLFTLFTQATHIDISLGLITPVQFDRLANSIDASRVESFKMRTLQEHDSTKEMFETRQWPCLKYLWLPFPPALHFHAPELQVLEADVYADMPWAKIKGMMEGLKTRHPNLRRLNLSASGHLRSLSEKSVDKMFQDSQAPDGIDPFVLRVFRYNNHSVAFWLCRASPLRADLLATCFSGSDRYELHAEVLSILEGSQSMLSELTETSSTVATCEEFVLNELTSHGQSITTHHLFRCLFCLMYVCNQALDDEKYEMWMDKAVQLAASVSYLGNSIGRSIVDSKTELKYLNVAIKFSARLVAKLPQSTFTKILLEHLGREIAVRASPALISDHVGDLLAICAHESFPRRLRFGSRDDVPSNTIADYLLLRVARVYTEGTNFDWEALLPLLLAANQSGLRATVGGPTTSLALVSQASDSESCKRAKEIYFCSFLDSVVLISPEAMLQMFRLNGDFEGFRRLFQSWADSFPMDSNGQLKSALMSLVVGFDQIRAASFPSVLEKSLARIVRIDSVSSDELFKILIRIFQALIDSSAQWSFLQLPVVRGQLFYKVPPRQIFDAVAKLVEQSTLSGEKQSQWMEKLAKWTTQCEPPTNSYRRIEHFVLHNPCCTFSELWDIIAPLSFADIRLCEPDSITRIGEQNWRLMRNQDLEHDVESLGVTRVADDPVSLPLIDLFFSLPPRSGLVDTESDSFTQKLFLNEQETFFAKKILEKVLLSNSIPSVVADLDLAAYRLGVSASAFAVLANFNMLGDEKAVAGTLVSILSLDRSKRKASDSEMRAFLGFPRQVETIDSSHISAKVVELGLPALIANRSIFASWLRLLQRVTPILSNDTFDNEDTQTLLHTVLTAMDWPKAFEADLTGASQFLRTILDFEMGISFPREPAFRNNSYQLNKLLRKESRQRCISETHWLRLIRTLVGQGCFAPSSLRIPSECSEAVKSILAPAIQGKAAAPTMIAAELEPYPVANIEEDDFLQTPMQTAPFSLGSASPFTLAAEPNSAPTNPFSTFSQPTTVAATPDANPFAQVNNVYDTTTSQGSGFSAGFFAGDTKGKSKVVKRRH